MRRYFEDLKKEFKLEGMEIPEEAVFLQKLMSAKEISDTTLRDSLAFSSIMNRIREIMKKEMPDPWYCYGINENKLSTTE